MGVTGGSEVTLTVDKSGAYVHYIKATIRETGKTYYTIDATADSNGTAYASPVYAAENDTITLTAVPNGGYKLDSWEVTTPTDNKPAITADGSDANIATFSMPASDVAVKAVFVEDTSATYNISVLNGYHGTASLKTGQGTNLGKDTEITLADVVEATADEGYTFKEWYVTQTPTPASDGEKVKASDITVADGKFTMPAGNVEIIPIFEGAAKGTYDFKNKNKTDRSKGSQIKDFSGIITFDGLKDDNNDHGFVTTKENATMTLNLSDKATVVVDTCEWNSISAGMTAAIGETSYTPEEGTSSKDKGKCYTVKTDKGGELILTLATNNNYVHSVEVTYDTGSSDTDSFVEDGETIDFSGQSKSHTDKGPVKAADVKSKVGDQEKVASAFAFSGFSWHGTLHGIHEKGSIELNLEQGKRAIITVTGCGYGSSETVATNSGVVIETETDTILPDDNTKASKFLILGAQGKVKLTFGGKNYIHEISVKYMTDSEHIVSVSSDENGTAAADITVAEKDTKITLTTEPNAGFEFDKWEVISGGVTVADDNTFIMSDTDVEIKAIFKSNGVDPAEIPDADGFYNGLLSSEVKDGRSYYYDFSTRPIDPWVDTFEKGLFTYDKGQAGKNAYWHSEKYGIEFAVGNKITFQVSGDSYIVVGGGDNNSKCDLLRASSEQGSISPESLNPVKGGQGTLAECKNRAGNVLVYEYTGTKGSVTLTFDTTDESNNKAYISCACVIPKEKENPDLPTYTYIFDPSLEGIAVKDKVTEAGNKFVNDYFEIVDGTVTGKGGKIELQNNAESAIQFTTKEQSAVSVVAESTSGSNKSNMVLYKLTSDNSWQIVDDIKVVEGNVAVTIKYENLEAGTYKVAVPSETHPFGRGVRISKVEVKENLTPVTVTVNASVPENAPALSLEFTCRETNKKITQAMENNTCAVVLNALYTYDVVVSPTTYVISEGTELKLGAANEDRTATHSITIEAVRIHTLEGLIKGLDEDAEALKNLQISFQKPEDKIYVPEISINRETKRYSAQLESGVEYLIVAEGINDYELDYTANNNSDRIKITSPVSGRNITYKKKPVYAVQINPEGAELTDLAEAVFEFTNLNEEGYVYTFTGTDNIKLRDGTYGVKVSNSGIYTPKLIPNLTIAGEDTVMKIRFTSEAATKWDFTNAENYNDDKTVKNPCLGLTYTTIADGMWKDHASNYGSMAKNIEIHVPVSGSGKVILAVGYTWDITSGDVSDIIEDNTDHGTKTIEIPYSNTEKVDITVGTKSTTYIKTIEVVEAVEYKETITVGVGENCDYNTINDALDAVRAMERTADQSVTISIEPGDYEEMLVIDQSNVKLVNAAGANASIGLRNKGINIDPNAVRITSYYGVGYNYYSMGSNYKWNEEVLEVNKANGSATCVNPPDGGTASFWNATVVISASNVTAEGIIFENSFNQYISKKAAEDVIVKQGGAKEGKIPRASMAYGDTTVQQKDYVERAAALAISNNCSNVMFNNCKFIGRQDTLYGGTPVTAAFYKCAIYGGTDYIFGGMTAVFAKCDLVFNTNDRTDAGIKNDVGYITASQTKSGNGYLMYNCHVTSTVPGVDTESQHTSKPGYLGRPWQANTGEAVFYKTIIDEVDAYWQDYYNNLPDDDKKKNELGGKSLIGPIGWDKSLNGESALSKEYGTYEVSGVDNSSSRASWATTLADNPYESDAAAVTAFLGSWDAFAGKDMTVVLPNDEGVPAPAQPKAIITPEAEKEDEAIKGAAIILSAEMGAKVYYNVNADGNPTETPEMLYKGAIDVTDENIKDNTITIKAIAVKYGKTSDVATFTYKVVEAPTPAKPVLTPEAGANVLLGSSIKMSALYGAKIYYNVNAEAAPTEQDTLYTGKSGVKLTLDMVNKEDSTVKIQAIAVMSGKTSDVTTVIYNVAVNKPVANVKSGYQFPDGGGKVKLTADEDVTILYTTGATADDAADPTLAESNPATYDKESSGIMVAQDMAIKAVAKRGSKYSAVVTLEYLVPLSMPVATPESGSVLPKNARTVLLSADEGATIYYTIGADSDPTVESEARKTYDPAQGIEVIENNTIIKAVAVKGDRQSMIAAFTYTISDEELPQAEAPTVTSVNGKPVTENSVIVEANTDVVVKLATATEGAEIYYTTDNKLPGASSNKYNDETGIAIAKIAEDTVIKAIAAKENFINSEILTFKVKIKTQGGGDDTDPDITVDDKAGIEIIGLEKEYEYTGAAITPDFDVVDNGIKENGTPRVLILGTDYTVKYKNNKKEGETATVTVVGKGNYSGKEVEGSFEIKSMPKVTDENVLIDLKGAKIAKIAPMPYTGEAQYPKFELTLKNGSSEIYEYVPESKQYVREKDKSADINVTISGNRNKGTATILVRGKKDSRGKVTSVKATFKITPVDLSTATVEVAESAYYAVKGATPAVTVSYQFKGAAAPTVLKAGRDYVVKYSGNKKAGATAKVVITGKGNYTKKAEERTFTVNSLSMQNTRLVAADVYEGAKAAKLKAVVVDTNDDALKASQYTVKAYTDKDCKTEYAGDDRGKCKAGDVIYLQAVAKDKKNLVEDSVTLEPLMVTVGANIAKAKVKLSFKTKAYTGTYVELAEGDLEVTIKDGRDIKTLKLKPEILVEGEEYDYEIISYSNNIYKGTATAVIRGIGKYSGTKTIKFKIAAKEMKKAKDPETTN